MKEQIKNRMEMLLQSEIEARILAKSTATSSHVSVTSTTSTAGQASVAAAGRTSGAGIKEEAKADVLFNMDSGKRNFHGNSHHSN